MENIHLKHPRKMTEKGLNILISMVVVYVLRNVTINEKHESFHLFMTKTLKMIKVGNNAC